MNRLLAAVILMMGAVGLAGCASSDVWTREDTKYELMYVAAASADAYTTSRIQYTYGVQEDDHFTRSILGANPRTDETWQYFGTMMIGHYLISRMLPEEYRRWWQIGGAGYHSYLAIHNCGNQLCR